MNNTFSDIQTFSFGIDVAAPLAPGTYSGPALNGIDYIVFCILVAGTPSGFPAFNLNRPEHPPAGDFLTGTEFYG